MSESKTYFSTLGGQYIINRLSQSRFTSASIEYVEPVNSSPTFLIPCSATLPKIYSYKTIKLDHPQWPFDLKNNPDENFKECPICLVESKEIKCCVILVSCHHRFCSECVKICVKCPICQVSLIESDEKMRITLILNNDEIWWAPTKEEEDKQSLTYAVDELCHILFGAINRLHTARVYCSSSFNTYAKISDARGKKLKLYVSYVQVRGLDPSLHTQEKLLNALILGMLYFHYPQSINIEELKNFIIGQWSHIKFSTIDKEINKLLKSEYCKWETEGMLKLINLTVAASNLLGYLFIPSDMYTIVKILYNLMIWSSILMHLSERKHGLPGIYPFNIFHRQFLSLDRTMALICTAVVCFFALMIVMELGLVWDIVFYIILGMIGLLFLAISECIITEEYKAFIFFHSSWHIIAYYIFCSMTRLFHNTFIIVEHDD